jgi:serine phosphatase RsbU (regulator of sigma subunit)/PAS domain-containing protein
VSAPPQSGRCLVLEGSPADLDALGALGDAEHVTADELIGCLTAAAGAVDLVVIGSLAAAAVSWVQRVHHLAPDVAVAVLTSDPVAVRRQASFAPGVPLELLVAAFDEPGLVERLTGLREVTVSRRRHAALVAAVVRRSAAGPAAGPGGILAVGALLEHAPIAAVLTTVSGDVLGWNRQAEVLLTLGPDAGGRSVDQLLPGALPVITAVAAVVSPAAAPDVAPRRAVQLPVGGRVLELSAVGSQTDDGRPVVLLFLSDVTAHRAAERERDRLADHVQLLGRVSESLMGRLESTEPLSRVADALIPALADWISIQVRTDKGIRSAVLRHRDPGLAAGVRAMGQGTAARAWLTEPSRRAAKGEVVFLPGIDPTDLTELIPASDFRSWVRRSGAASAIAVPIPGRTDVLGSMLLVRGPDARAFDTAELALAIEVGRRAGIALDNARLYAGQRELATELQRSLLTAPPGLTSADVAVRYVAATREAQVGGDWYDAFRRRSGDLVMVIGDVVGHDSRAAAAMGQLRGILRGIAFRDDDAPGQVLRAVDEAVEGLELSTIASAVLAELSPPRAPGNGGDWQLRWSNAGHPAPVLLESGGQARLLDSSRGKADLLLGIDSSTTRATEQLSLVPGATLVLYTDGLVERRGETLDDGLDRLLRAVERHGAEDLEALCDALLADLVPDEADDDIAIVAVRLHPSAVTVSDG